LVEVRLYGSLRRFAVVSAVDAESTAYPLCADDDTVETVLLRLGIDPGSEVSNTFINGRYYYHALEMQVNDGDRLGVFPKDMGMLYA
jgi:molybdopterin converting factor small subunit